MALEEKDLRGGSHRILLDSRQKLTVSGVEEVERFDEASIIMATTEGTLVITGSGLHIEKLSLDGGDLMVEGQVDGLSYEESESREGSLWGRLFRR